MKITKLTATFGKFNNESISFREGLNVIYAPNESGKSTWCAFIKAMLYGMDSSERAHAGYIPDKQHYSPWSGAPMEGSMELTADKCDITITRTTRNKNAPMQDFRAVYTGTATPVRNMTGTTCGEQLTGISRDVFCRSAFVGQGSSVISGSPEMEKRIQSLLSTGEEETSFSEAEERLLSWQRKRKFNRRGMLPDIDRKIEDAVIHLDSVNKSAEKLAQLEEELAEAQRDCAALENAVTDARKEHRRAVIGGLNDARSEARRLSSEQNAALAELNDRRDALRQSIFGPRKGEDVEAQASRDMEEIRSLRDGMKRGVSVVPVILFFILALAGAVAFEKLFHHLAVIIAAGVFCIAALVFLFLFVRNRQSINLSKEKISAILRRYGAVSPDDIPEKVEGHLALCAALKDAAEKERAAAAAADAAYDNLHRLENNATHELDFASGNSRAAELGKKLSEKRRSTSQLSLTVASEESRLSMLGDPVVLRGELNCLETERESLRNEYDAIDTALTALREADDEIQSRFSPQLGAVAARYMCFVTDGKYEDVMLSKDFSAMARARDDVVAHDSGYLSAGTADLLYLAVRLAVCELALPDGEPCPLIIDDALVNLDDERYGQAMKLLAEIARERQVILFTCRQNA